MHARYHGDTLTDPDSRRNRHEAGIECGRVDGLARLAEGALDDIVVGRVELKFELVAHGGGNAVWLEHQAAIANSDHVSGGGIGKGQEADNYG